MGDLRSLHLAPWIELHEAVRQKSRPRGIRVAGAAPTNEQVFSLVRSIADSEPGQAVAYVPAKDVELSVWARRPNFSSLRRRIMRRGGVLSLARSTSLRRRAILEISI